MKKVMVVIDESNSSYDLLSWVLQNLKDSIQSSQLLIFASQPAASFIHNPAPLGYAPFFFPFSSNAGLTWLAQEKNRKVSLGLLEKAKKICGNHGIKAETFTEPGNLKEVICNAIQEHKIDLLVISDQQNRYHRRCFQGSLSEYCLQNAKCSVLVVKTETCRDHKSWISVPNHKL